MLTLMLINISLSIMFMFISHPLSMGLIMFMQTIVSATIISWKSSSSWYSYILFLVMIGGMMILFIYMTSVASNEKFMFNMQIMLTSLTSLILILMYNLFFMSMKMDNMNSYNLITKFNKFCSNPLYTSTIFMFIYLLITMIATVKITSFNQGPLRQMY